MNPQCATDVFKESGVLVNGYQCENPLAPQKQAFLFLSHSHFHSVSLTHDINDGKYIKQQHCQAVLHQVLLRNKQTVRRVTHGGCTWAGMYLDVKLFFLIGGSSLNRDKKMSCI